jgi:hypothetical protein
MGKCGKCGKKKEKMRSTSLCQECYNKEKQYQQGKKSHEEELQERENIVILREDKVTLREEEVMRKEEIIKAQEAELTKFKEQLEKREAELKEKEEKLEENLFSLKQKRSIKAISPRKKVKTFLLKHKRDVQEISPRKKAKTFLLTQKRGIEDISIRKKAFPDLGQRSKQYKITNAIKYLHHISKGNLKDILSAIQYRLFRKRDMETEVQLAALRMNIAKFCQMYLSTSLQKSRIVAMLTQSLSLSESHKLTGIALSSIAWGRKEILNGRLIQTEVSYYFY